MPKYGLISETDGRTIEKTLDLLCTGDTYELNITEIGLFNCETSVGIMQYLKSKNRLVRYIGIDNEKDKPIDAPEWLHYIKGNSTEVYNQIEDKSQHVIFFDGCHCLAHVISDFFCYMTKIKDEGFLIFHDTGRHIKKFKDFQHGERDNPDAYISVRKALDRIGMFNDAGYDLYGQYVSARYVGNYGFVQIFDAADIDNEAGGVIVYRKKTKNYLV